MHRTLSIIDQELVALKITSTEIIIFEINRCYLHWIVILQRKVGKNQAEETEQEKSVEQ